MRYGDQEKWFAQLEADGQTVPAPQQPSITGLEWIWDAWGALNTCRAIGMDVGPVPWTATRQYADAHGMDRDEFDLLWYCIRHLEQIYREDIETKRKRRQKQHATAKRKARR